MFESVVIAKSAYWLVVHFACIWFGLKSSPEKGCILICYLVHLCQKSESCKKPLLYFNIDTDVCSDDFQKLEKWMIFAQIHSNEKET